MAFRYLIYSTGTTFAETIVRESATDNPGANEASLYSEFIIPEIQPVYLWRVTGGTDVVPNTDANINNYLDAIAPPPEPRDDASVGYVTGITSTKIDKVTGATGNLGEFNAEGNLVDTGYAVSDLTGGTQYNFTGSGATQVSTGSTTGGTVQIIIYSTEPTGTTVAWGDITGTLSAQTDLQNALDAKLDDSVFNTFTGTTLPNDYYNKTEINAYTASTEATLTGITEITDIALTGATNGLTPNGRNVELGGDLTQNTVISGTSFDFTLNPQSITLQAPNGIDIIDTDGVGGVNIESDAGTVSLIGNTNLGVEQTKLEISETLMRITDSRGTQVGLQYAADYSTDFTNESLITKRYADTIAGGLIPKAAVLVATTADSGLSGLTTIDGVVLTAGDRVLVKDNTDASENGIYIAASGAWSRSDDYDGTPDGEVSAGNIIPVISGNTQYSTLWVLVTPNPITIDVTDLDFTLYSSPHEMIAGTGINISGNEISVDGASLAGNSISWTGNTFNVDINSGTLSTALTAKLNVTDFNTFTGTTLPANYISTTDFTTFTGTTLPANYYNKTEINSYTGTTDQTITNIENSVTGLSATTATKLDTAVFSAYTGTTAPNEIFLIHTGGTELNTVLATAIEWDTANVSGSSFNWTGSSEIQVLETGDYEISYNVPFTSNENNRTMGIGGNIILNNSTVSNNTSSGAVATDSGAVGMLSLTTVILSLTADDVLTLAAFRTSDSGSATSAQNGSILIKKKNTLQ